MGKALILSGGTGGYYTIRLIFPRENINAKIADLQAKITAYETEIAGMEEGPAKTMAIFKKNILVKRKEYYEDNMPDDPVIEAWCADFTEDLTGEVGTIEVPGERGSVNIQPGYNGNAVYNSDRDGQLQPAIASKSAAGTFYNIAVLPGWQKWWPSYRYGRIKSIDRSGFVPICSVELDDIRSSQQSLDINYLIILENITMDYMGVGVGQRAFNIDDHVIIKFDSSTDKTIENWENQTISGIVVNPTINVIGFVDNPVSFTFHFKLTRGDGTLITQAGGLFSGFTIYDSTGSSIGAAAPTYDEESEYWSVTITDFFTPYDKNGYWINYDCTYGAETQYPYRYKTADQQDSADLIHPGYYEDTIPYWRVVTVNTGDIEQIGNIYQRTYTVYSSISYRYTYYVEGVANRKPHIAYSCPDFIPDGLNDAGQRCCNRSFRGYIADINPINVHDDQALLYIIEPGGWPVGIVKGGWGDSYVELKIESVGINFTETYPAIAAVLLEHTAYSGATLAGAEYSIKMTNTTTPHASREMTCYGPPCSFPDICDYEGTDALAYYWSALGDPDETDDHLKFGIRDFDYDF